jgi:nucleoside-diphosphate-sugar epimerase
LPPIPGQQNITALYAVNVGATANLVNYCLKVGVKHLVFASTQAVYGMPHDVLTEQSPCTPLEHYAASKLYAEQLLEVTSKQGLQVTIARFPGLYSECRPSGVVYNFCKAALQKKEIIVACNYPLPLDVIHVQDVVQAFIKMIEIKHQYYLRLNIATGQPCTLNLLADSVAALVPGCRVTHSLIAQPMVTMDTSLAKKILNWQAESQAERLQQMLASIKADQLELNTGAMHERFL